MLGVLLGLALILGAADHWTTWLCLTGGFGERTLQTLGASPAGSV